MASPKIHPIDIAITSNQELEAVQSHEEMPVLEVASLTMTRGSAVPSQRGGSTLTQAANGKVYLIGGANREAESFGDVHAFDLVARRWERVIPSSGSLPPRSGHSTVAVGNELIVFGGFNAREGVVYNDVHVFNCDTQLWTRVVVEGELPKARNAHVALLLPSHDQESDTSMLVFGGSSPYNGAFDDVFLLHLRKANTSESGKYRWEKLHCSGEQPEARELHCGVVVSGSSICFLGGRNQHGSMCTDMVYLDTATWKWQVIPMCGWARCSHVAGLVDGILTSFGGFDGSAVCGDCWQFCDQIDEWRPAQTLTSNKADTAACERFGHCGATIVSLAGDSDNNNSTETQDQALLMFGGMNAEADLHDVVLISRQRRL